MANQSTEQELLAALQQSATIIQRHKKALAAYHEPIAIIGMGCHYPGGGETPDHFWQQLLAGFDAIIELPHARAMDFVGEQTPPAGFLNAVDQFDPSISKRQKSDFAIHIPTSSGSRQSADLTLLPLPAAA